MAAASAGWDIVAAAIAVGLPVFPCRLDKRPACPHGFKDAAVGAESISMLWRTWPGPLIGVPTGFASGLFVLDIDPEGRVWLNAIFGYRRMPATRVHQTRRGGFHLIFELPKEPLPNSAGKLARGVDTRGEGGYVIWPPSPGYEVVDESLPARVPRWLENRLRKPKEPRAGAQLATAPRASTALREGSRDDARKDALIRFVVQSGNGQRNTRLFWAACRAAELGDNGLKGALIGAAMQAGLPQIEAARTVESAWRQPQQRGAA